MTATCIITNCRRSAPSSEPFCSVHRDKPVKPQQMAAMLVTLIEIGAYADVHASSYLARTGSFSQFDEPHSVAKARACLDAIGEQP